MNLFVKVVTCGNVPLESSFQKVPRCVYTSTSLYEYRGWDSKAANATHRRFTWGLRSSEVSSFLSFDCGLCYILILMFIMINYAETCGGLLYIGFPIWIKSIG